MSHGLRPKRHEASLSLIVAASLIAHSSRARRDASAHGLGPVVSRHLVNHLAAVPGMGARLQLCLASA